jgi:fused signal recognition particle receptor
MAGWLTALARTRGAIAGALGRVFRSPQVDAETLEALEEVLLRADAAPRWVAGVLEQLREESRRTRAPGREALSRILTASLSAPSFTWASDRKPRCILIVGVNGSGKTTTCAKLAQLSLQTGRRVLLGASDTYRAAGSEQLRLWAGRIGCDVVVGATGADAAAAAYDALDAGFARGADDVIIDTAGRMHTREPLMRELEKVRRALVKRLQRDPDETWIVLDAALGQNAIAQAKKFHAATPLTGAIVSKLDGSSKAGFIFSIQKELGIPVPFVGLGEGADDLTPLDPEAFVRALLAEDSNHVER